MLMRRLTPVFQAVAGIVLAGAAALLIGWGSRYAYVALMGPLVIGLSAGAGVAIVGLRAGLALRRSAWAAAALGVLVGLGTLAWMDDVQFRATFARDLAESRLIATGASGELLRDEDELEFYALGSDEELEEQVIAAVGSGGVGGRWLYRAQSGVRLLGPWSSGRGLAVGQGGAIAWTLLELLIALLVARSLLARVGRARARSEDLGDQGGDQERAAEPGDATGLPD